MTKIKGSAFLLIGISAVVGLYLFEKRSQEFEVAPGYQNEINEFRSNAETRLRGPEGWLTVVGLHWLKDGTYAVGSDPSNNIVLPSSSEKHLGAIQVAGTLVKMKLDASADVDGTPQKQGFEFPLLNDEEYEKPTLVKSGSVRFFLLKRKNGLALRVKDEDAEARKKFAGRNWYPPKANFRIDAEWIPFDPPKKVAVPDILGNLNEEVSPGFARFQIEGETFDLTPTVEGDQLFFVFRDQTSGQETYGAARFLYSDFPQNNRVILDFNKAYNPPCAFTSYATCPMPMKENILKVAIRAGELKTEGH